MDDQERMEKAERVVWRNITGRKSHGGDGRIHVDTKAGGLMMHEGRDLHISRLEAERRGRVPRGVVEERYDPQRHGEWRGKEK